MKKLFQSLLAVLFFSFFAQAQETGMHFEHNATWKEILAKAKTENKYIFVDCYTTWCGPCKRMSAEVFPKEEAGKFYNDKFINVKFQLDKTEKDNDEVKAKYEDAAVMATLYNVKSYPTFLIFNPNGTLVHRDIGYCDIEEFIQRGVNALNPEKQYYTQLQKYKLGDKDPAVLRTLILNASRVKDFRVASSATKDYFSSQSDLFSEDNIKFIYKITRTVEDTGFALMMNNYQKFETVIGKDKLKESLFLLILNEEVSRNKTLWIKWDENKWQSYIQSTVKKYPLFGNDISLHLKLTEAGMHGKWNQFASEVDNYLVSNVISAKMLNGYAWNIFSGTTDTKILESAAVWSKKSFSKPNEENPGFMDTYANILYKMGKTKEAIEWETKAVSMLSGKDAEELQKTLDKMNKGEKTWQ